MTTVVVTNGGVILTANASRLKLDVAEMVEPILHAISKMRYLGDAGGGQSELSNDCAYLLNINPIITAQVPRTWFSKAGGCQP